MKFLILSSDFATDRDSVAAAVCDAATNAGIECVLADPCVFTVDGKIPYSKLIKRIPGAMSVIRGAKKMRGKDVGAFFPASNFVKNLNECIENSGFDAVISADKAVTETLTGYYTSAPFYAVLTDYNCPDVSENAPFDTYFIPHESLRGELIAKNVPEEKITVFGVPVPMKFKKRLGRRAARKYLVIPEKQKVYLVLASGMSAKNAEEICESIARTEDGDYSVYCLCGRESDTLDELSERYLGDKKIRIVTYTEKINIYMEAADVVLSRPVGIISAEAAVSAVPLVHITPKSGFDKTAEFFSSHEMALKGFDVRDAVNKAKRLLENSAVSERMKKIQQATVSADSAEKIVGKITDAIGHRLTT